MQTTSYASVGSIAQANQDETLCYGPDMRATELTLRPYSTAFPAVVRQGWALAQDMGAPQEEA